ncbi:hypothetical protein [Bacillus sp. FDAARGOS_1420]|uniref:hypothetical protein n=1 Tax=unclassified Bacillus (in: firmicutes) TaxID=185979 RepID=UPI00214BA7E7|nr:hypothetical protein [Bacillus sp. FDAARGOS_1420]
MQHFLNEPTNYALFEQAILKPTIENKQQLDTAFQIYFKNIKMVNYISKLIYFYSIDFDKKISRYNKRNYLHDDSFLTQEIATTVDATLIEYDKKQKSIKDCVSDQALFRA